MTTKEFYRKLSVILSLGPDGLKGDELLADLKNWDSMSVLLFIDMVDLDLGVVVSAGALLNCKSVGDLKELCQGKVQD
jgi:acyl carrier protein